MRFRVMKNYLTKKKKKKKKDPVVSFEKGSYISRYTDSKRNGQHAI